MRTYFDMIAVGESFICNGTAYTKASNRTAKLAGNGRVFYFKNNEQVRPL